MKNTLGNFCISIGAQWGDEGKGKLVDILAKDYDVIVRAAGGANAGHTIEVEDKKYILHLIPSGILQGKTCIIGNGCVLHLPQILKEISELKEAEISVKDKLFISDRAHILFDFHKIIDATLEERKGEKKIGSTKRGIGPAYTSKIARFGVRMGDLVYNFDYFEERFRALVTDLEMSYKIHIDTEAELIAYRVFQEQFKEMVICSDKYVHDKLEAGQTILAEGAQGAMLDIDHGTYPFVTSSNTSIGGTCAGIGISPTKASSVLAIVKAYTTRVGAGPFPTELDDKNGETLAKNGHEFGATTGRSRRCGWLDMVQLKAASRVNGFTHINLTKLDVLSGMKEVQICTKYTLNGKEVYNIPLNNKDCEDLQCDYQSFPGWEEDISQCKNFADLPKNAQEYVQFIEKEINCPASFIGVGPKRDQIIVQDQ
ncbi:adenylosuccinate synthase [Candidatus Peregrinibacteria bacterium]|jgi:adenylosuccinate synthase|nr:adenylosuccinate synthase [Candidatus Peregrinibacteria bacterium]